MIDHVSVHTRRTVLAATAGAGLGLAMASDAGAAEPAVAGGSSVIRPFKVKVPDAKLADLRRRIIATEWPEKETAPDHSQGVPLALMQDTARYWAGGYDWRRCEARLNALPQFMTEIDGLDIHFIHVRSKHESAMPMIITHGWPGSVVEQLKIIAPLTDPEAHGGSAADAFHLVIPSVPGYGFSGKPATPDWDPAHIGRAWTVLMKRLGYERFVAQGGDIGAIITTEMGRQAPPELLAVHISLPGVVPPEVGRSLAAGSPPPPELSADEKRTYEQLRNFMAAHFAYALMMSTRPQTLYALADSPVGLAAWMIDHGDGYDQPASSVVAALTGRGADGHGAGELTRDDVLDNITLYWVTGTAVSAARFYWANKGRSAAGAANLSFPAAVTAFPGEIYQAPRSWTERAYPKLIYFNLAERGGHYAAWEEPQVFAREMRAAFKPLRAE